MRRKTIIVLMVTFMVTVMVAAFSYLYVSQVLRQRLKTASEEADLMTRAVANMADNVLPDITSTPVDTDNPKAVQAWIEDYLKTDTTLKQELEYVLGNFPFAYDVALVDLDDRAVLHSNPEKTDKILAARPRFDRVLQARFPDQLRMIYSPPAVYDVVYRLDLDNHPFGTVRIGISTVLLKDALSQPLRHAIVFSVLSILLSLVLAAFISNLALGPLKTINENLDDVTGAALGEESSSGDELGLVTLKIANLGRQVRDAKEIFSALKDNVDQLMANLQDGLMLFTRDSRVVLVSAPVERFLGKPRGELLGRKASEVFSEDTILGALVLEAFRKGRGIGQREVRSMSGRQCQLSMDFIHEKSAHIGALLVMRDTESVRRIEDEIEMSRRLSASSRVTRGVGHEFKNPINAIVLHLHLLQSKLQQFDPGTRRHVDIIDSEIRRLDRLVQRLMDIYPRRDLQLEEIDLSSMLEDVAVLAQPEAEQCGVKVLRDLPERSLTVKVDTDFMKQAILNVVINGIQAMPEGGTLTIRARRHEGLVTTEIVDTGAGIPPEVQDKIFELYFTTKPEGSGIGLAQTYQVLQWHYGSLDFETSEGQGTTFRLRIPLADSTLDVAREAVTRTR